MSERAPSVNVLWDEVVLRDGVTLAAIVYLPRAESPAPCIVALTPYLADHLHDRAMYFAQRGFAFIAVDVRGRGNSAGEFSPMIQEAEDGPQVIEWVKSRRYCNARIAMYGGSYLGYAQWITATKCRAGILSTIVPTASPYVGVDVPMRSNIFSPVYLRWLTVVSGRTTQDKITSDWPLWLSRYREWQEGGGSLEELGTKWNLTRNIFQEWLEHPGRDAYWDTYNPSTEDYMKLEIPILSITGAYDGDQPGALEHYRRHQEAVSPAARGRHFLVIGPWNHVGCAKPEAAFEGLKVGPESVIDLYELHAEWYGWVMGDGPRPKFLKDQVAYYVTGAERWRYTGTLDAATERVQAVYLQANSNPTDVFGAGRLSSTCPMQQEPSCYVYDPRDIENARTESELNVDEYLTDQTLIHASFGRRLIWHSEPFADDVEITGFFRLVAWISIDQPDTDFRVWIYEINGKGESLLLALDSMRARYRGNTRKAELVVTRDPLPYEFKGFTFISRQIKRGHRIRLVLGPINSIFEEKNYNSGGAVAKETVKVSRAVTVRVFSDTLHPSSLLIPIGKKDS